MAEQETSLALFPLDVVVFPGGIQPLHIFEPRYRKLVADRLEDDRPFGIVFGKDDAHAEIGCAVDVAGVLQKLPDGRLNIVTRGYRRFRIVQPLTTDRPYAVADVAWLDDAPGPAADELASRARELFRCVAEAYGWGINLPVDVERDPVKLSWLLGDSMHLTNQAKQELLELPSPDKRFETEIRWLKALPER